jgi:predicted DNA-binding transcriptional regulator YafY
MRRADRLFQIVQHLRGGRLVTAQKLGEWLEVSERTIYRDIADLQSTGVPIDGEAGVGYLMREGFDLPPLMFTRDEIVALVAGARMVRAFGGAAMARAADEALVKIGAVLPESEKARISKTEIHTPMWVVTDQDRANIDFVERAVEARQVLTLDYRDEAGRSTERDIRPLGLWFWGKVWTVAAWCELRSDFRAFRIDRIASVRHAGRNFKPERGKSLAEFYRRMERESEPVDRQKRS